MSPTHTSPPVFTNPVSRILEVIRLEKNEISSVYFYAVLNGLIQLSLPVGIQSIISFVLGGSLSASLVVLIFVVVFGVFLNGQLQVNQMKLIEKVQQKIFVRYSFEITERIPRIQLQKTDNKFLPELVNRFFDTISLQKGISKLLLDIPAATIQIFFGLLLLSFYHFVFIFFGITLITVIYLILKATSARGLQSSIRESDYKYGVAGWIEELARAVYSFKLSRKKEISLEKTDSLVTGYLTHRTEHFRVLMQQYWTLIVFKVLITTAMLVVGSYLLLDQQLNIGQFIAAEIVILMVINSVEKLIINLDNVYDVLTSVDKLSKIIDIPLEKEGGIAFQHPGKPASVEVRGLTFSYRGDLTQPELSDVTFSVKPGEKVCIMGRAGAGKSTLLKLLTGSYPNYEGIISVNEVPLVNYDLGDYRSRIGVKFNNQDIFDGTLLSNILMTEQVEDITEMIRITEMVGLKPYIDELPEGFQTHLQPLGNRLSQKITQKILLCRALTGKPDLILLEEPFEGIEEKPRQSIIHYLLSDSIRSTLVISTNDVDFARKCDLVIFLKDGKVKSIGPWSQIESEVRQ